MLNACATEEDVVKLLYTPSETATPIVEDSKTIKLEVADNRGVYRGQIGAKVNGYGEEMAAIRTTVPIREIVRNAFAEELKRRNIMVDERQHRTLEVSITALHNNFQVGFLSGSARGIAVFRVRVIGADGVTRYDQLTSQLHEVEEVALALGEPASQSVGAALDEAMDRLFDDPDFQSALVKS